MSRKNNCAASLHRSSSGKTDDSAPSYTVEKRGGVLNVTFTSGEHKGEKSVFFETSPSLAYFNTKK